VRILFITSAHNSLSQRLQIELADRGHTVAVHLATSDEAKGTAVNTQRPDLIVAPMLKKRFHGRFGSDPSASSCTRASRATRAIVARLGDRARRALVGRDDPAGSRGDGCGADLGRGGLSAAEEARHQERRLSARGRRSSSPTD
jgi:hypothetical protein